VHSQIIQPYGEMTKLSNIETKVVKIKVFREIWFIQREMVDI